LEKLSLEEKEEGRRKKEEGRRKKGLAHRFASSKFT
jgi:hypothetical protein